MASLPAEWARPLSLGEPINDGTHITVPVRMEYRVLITVGPKTYEMGWISRGADLPAMLRAVADMCEQAAP